MKTRMELWKEYRLEINRHIDLNKTLLESDESLKILFKRVKKVFPEYEQKYPSTNHIDLDFADTIGNRNTTFSPKVFNEIHHKIVQTQENDKVNLSALENIDFTHFKLKKVLEDLDKEKIRAKTYVDSHQTKNISLKTTYVNLKDAQMKINIAIDGPSSSGKSSVAKLVAERFNLRYVNTGLVYRAIALYFLQHQLDLNDESSLKKALSQITIDLKKDEITFLNGQEVGVQLRSDEVSQVASKVASLSFIRKFALKIMQDEIKSKGNIMDGRDTTFRVMPNADLKFFIQCSAEVRAQRRVEQNRSLGYNVNYEEVLKEIQDRDERDYNRAVDPLQIVPDAIVLDSSTLTLEEMVELISSQVKAKKREKYE